MQADQITLQVDPANNDTIVPEVFTRYVESENRSEYIGVNHLPEARNKFALYRTFPTRSGNFKGVAKSAVKFTEDKVVPGVDAASSLTAPAILEISFSVPVGVSIADIVALRQRAIAALDDDTVMNALNTQLLI